MGYAYHSDWDAKPDLFRDLSLF